MKKILKFLLSLIAVFLLIAGYAYLIEPNLLIAASLSVETKKEIIPCRIVFFTDTHFGKYYHESHVEKLVKKINEQEADFIIFGGDLFDNYARDRQSMDFEYLKSELEKLEASKGKYAVWGNHDYGGGAVRIYENFMTSCGFQLLDDESRFIEEYGINFVGYDDYLMGRTDPALYMLENNFFTIIIAHEPVVAELIKSNGGHFLLSGHTHGGQVSIPFLTSGLLPNGSGEFIKGLYSVEKTDTASSLQMYTSSGIGMTRYPFRFLNIPEIVVLDLQSQP